MANPLGNPEDQDAINVTNSAAETQITHGLQSIEFVNMSGKDIYYGGSSVTKDKGAPIFSGGGRRTFEQIPAGWKISFVVASGTAELRRIDYK